MAGKPVVTIFGLIPERANLAPFPGLTPEKIHAGIRMSCELLEAAGYEARQCFLPPEVEEAETQAIDYLKARQPDVVCIGAGVRMPADHVVLLERLIQAVRDYAPQARLCFNTMPTDTVAAVRRWV